MGYDQDSKQDLLKDLKNKDINFKPNPTPFIETNTTRGWTARFFVIESFDDPSWKNFFYTLDTIKNKTFPKAPDTIEPLTLEILTKLNIDDVIKFFKTSVQSGTGKSGGEKLSGIKLVKLTKQSECETSNAKGTYIHYKWGHSKSPAKNPPNDKFFVYFFKESDTDNSGRGGAYAVFANTCSMPNKDPEAKSFTNSDFSITVNGKKYPTSEHYFQINKFKKPEASYNAMVNQKADTLPGFARDNITNFGGQRDDWNSGGSIGTMIAAVRAKFAQNRDLGKLLLSTYPKILVEDTAQRSTGDPIWGANTNYTGCNQLGQVLMHVRQELHDGTYYLFNKGDAKYYYDLLSGNTAWKQDQNPDKTLIPDGYDQLLKTVEKQETSEALPPDTAVMHLAELLKLLA